MTKAQMEQMINDFFDNLYISTPLTKMEIQDLIENVFDKLTIPTDNSNI